MKLLLAFFLLLACLNLNAQTVIDYANFTGSGCVFTSSTDVPATINGTSGNIKHQTSVGEVDYGNTTHVLYFKVIVPIVWVQNIKLNTLSNQTILTLLLLILVVSTAQGPRRV